MFTIMFKNACQKIAPYAVVGGAMAGMAYQINNLEKENAEIKKIPGHTCSNEIVSFTTVGGPIRREICKRPKV